MNVTGKTKIYRRDFNGRPSYSRAISSQEYKDGQKGEWMTVFEAVQLPKDTDIADRSIIEVTKGFEATYKSKNGIMRKLVVMEFDVLDGEAIYVDEDHKNAHYTALTDDDVPF